MANIRVKDLPNTNAANDNDEFIVDSSTSGTRRLSYAELKSEISTDFAADVATYGIATLDSDNKLTASQIPDSLAQGMNFVGVANSAGDLTSTTQGDFYVIQTAFGVYSVGDQAVYDGSAYVRVVDGTKEITEGGTGATTLDDAKGNLEVPDVGTAPNEVPLNGQLGTMAFQDSAGISVGEVEASNLTVEAASASTDPILTTQAISGASTITGLQVTAAGAVTMSQNLDLTGDEKAIKFHSWESGNQIERALIKADGDPSGAGFGGSLVIQTSDDGTFAERMRVDPQGRVGIGTSSPSAHCEIDGGSSGQMKVGNGTQAVRLYADADEATILADGSVDMRFYTGGTKRWHIDASNGNLVANGTGIDFGSTTTGSGTVTANGGLLSDYEEGTFTVTTAGDATGAISAQDGYYTKVGNLVTVRLTFVVSTTFTGNQVSGLPFLPQIAGASGVSSGTVALTSNINGSPVIAHASHLSSSIKFISGTNTGGAHVLNTTNSAYRLFMSYYTS
jgi:hypothetical protein